MPQWGTEDQDAGTFGDVWLKGFKEATTDVQWLQPVQRPPGGTVPGWFKYFEHFDEDAGEKGMFAACAKRGLGECRACDSSKEKTRKVSARWAVNGLDSQGRQELYKVGGMVKDVMLSREQRGHDVTATYTTIVKEGTKLNTKYIVEVSDRPTRPFEGELHDPGPIIGETYARYVEALDGPVEEQGAGGDPWVEPPAGEAQAETPPPAAEPKAEEPAPTPPAAEAKPEQSEQEWAGSPEDWATPKLRKYAAEKGLGLGDRAPRSKLVTAVDKHLADNPPF